MKHQVMPYRRATEQGVRAQYHDSFSTGIHGWHENSMSQPTSRG